MKLFLASEAGDRKTFEDIQKFVGRLSNKKVAFVVTASNGYGSGFWRRGNTIRLVKDLAGEMKVVELENYLFENVIESIRKSDVVWFGGGMAGYLLYWIRRVGLDEKMAEILKKTIYIGSSAGAMIASKTQHLLDVYPGEEERGASVIPGLGLVDFEILPHFEDHLLPQIEKIWKFNVLLRLLKNGEAITVVDGKIEVLGEERILKNDFSG